MDGALAKIVVQHSSDLPTAAPLHLGDLRSGSALDAVHHEPFERGMAKLLDNTTQSVDCRHASVTDACRISRGRSAQEVGRTRD